MAGQSDSHMSFFPAEEIEFMAEDELVEIVPNLRMDSLNFICGDYGPFHPQIAVQVPLWLAVALKKRGKSSPVDVNCARDDIPDIYMVRSLIEDIRDVRFHKVETNLEKFTASAVTRKNMSAMEVNIIRVFSGRALQVLYKHESENPIPDIERKINNHKYITTGQEGILSPINTSYPNSILSQLETVISQVTSEGLDGLARFLGTCVLAKS